MRDDYIELQRSKGSLPRPEHDPEAVRKTAKHLQVCLMALEKIKSIAGPGPISQIASDATLNKPWNAGGTDGGIQERF